MYEFSIFQIFIQNPSSLTNEPFTGHPRDPDIGGRDGGGEGQLRQSAGALSAEVERAPRRVAGQVSRDREDDRLPVRGRRAQGGVCHRREHAPDAVHRQEQVGRTVGRGKQQRIVCGKNVADVQGDPCGPIAGLGWL